MINSELIIVFAIFFGVFHSTAVQCLDFYDAEVTQPNEVETTQSEINCMQFSEYAINCTKEAIIMYNTSRFSPPAAYQLDDWCKSIKHLSQCGMQWNEYCSELTDSHFHEESVKGHAFVVSSICDNEAYLERYKWNTNCIPRISSDWEYCYRTFKDLITEQKNGSYPWTHYETHFQLCCIRAQFRRCTLERLTAVCDPVESIVLQKFSVIISEGEVYQVVAISVRRSGGAQVLDGETGRRIQSKFLQGRGTFKHCGTNPGGLHAYHQVNVVREAGKKRKQTKNCERGVVYEKCPGGDPRPTQDMMPSIKPMAHMHVMRNSVHVLQSKCEIVWLLIFVVSFCVRFV